ncbi:endoglucanase 8 isoform X3 [Manihot esculenta]|uniref:Endoglucanase n=1 Tax=Manihot esculenta TaxID=3983 RepID=A0A2C9UIF3_MANES|nr:endoglucanase 8 isoform X3 [Manihot esculenta]OAY30493.1 hypothetical protein MANES_14G035100v8 [Manihot esculenta]
MVSKVALLGLAAAMSVLMKVSSQNYGDALTKSILFFEGQRSGKIPSTQRVTWRKDSALLDGSSIGMDLVGGYYDAGDNIKFNFPMAFTTTMLAWSVLEFGPLMGSDLEHALEAIQWSTDYLLKSTSVPGTVVAQVGEPISDHNCWERPEDMDTPRTTYVVNQTHPGSELSAEIAAALAVSSLVFKTTQANYSNILLERASSVFDFADNFQGSYDGSVGQGVCPYYCDYNGYQDELLWGAAWLYKATNDGKYWDYILKNASNSASPFVYRRASVDSIGNNLSEFGWDSKEAGINILVSGWAINTPNEKPFTVNGDNFVCSILPESPTKSVTFSPGGLLFKSGGTNLQHATSLSFLLIAYARYLEKAKRGVSCGNVAVTPARIINFAKGQVDYILGKNPLGMSYMVGFGEKYPQRIHHRGSSIPSVDKHPGHIACHEGTSYFESKDPNPNLHVGAVVGGPDSNDQFSDDRTNAAQLEPTTYINAPLVGVLAYFKSLQSRSEITH